jgi:hypothetical protein
MGSGPVWTGPLLIHFSAQGVILIIRFVCA